MARLYGSLDLTKIPKELIKKVTMKDGSVHCFLNISVGERKEPAKFGERIVDHFVSCAPKKDEQKEGVNYFIGDLTLYNPQPDVPTAEQIQNAPSVTEDDDLPF